MLICGWSGWAVPNWDEKRYFGDGERVKLIENQVTGGVRFLLLGEPSRGIEGGRGPVLADAGWFVPTEIVIVER